MINLRVRHIKLIMRLRVSHQPFWTFIFTLMTNRAAGLAMWSHETQKSRAPVTTEDASILLFEE